jgi:hypothetical protein
MGSKRFRRIRRVGSGMRFCYYAGGACVMFVLPFFTLVPMGVALGAAEKLGLIDLTRH